MSNIILHYITKSLSSVELQSSIVCMKNMNNEYSNFVFDQIHTFFSFSKKHVLKLS